MSKVILTAKPSFIDRLQGPFERSQEGFPSNAKRDCLEPSARRAALLAHMDQHPTIRIRQYAAFTGLSQKEASAELHRFADPSSPDVILISSGTGSHLVFVRRK